MSTILTYIAYFLLSYSALTIALFMLSQFIPVCGFFARLLASYISLVIAASYGVFVSIFLRIIGYGRISQWAAGRAFKYIMLVTTGIKFKIEDPDDYLSTTRPAVFIGNHQTELDVLMLGYIFPRYCSVTAKASLKRLPFLGWFMSLSGSVFIDRKNTKNAREAMTGAAEEMRRENQSVYMFPEGTRSYYKEPGLLPFKKGAFHLAIQANVPIVPVVVANYSEILHVPSWRFRSGEILVKVLKPIPTTRLKASDVDDLARDTRELMLKEITALTARQRGQPIAMQAQHSEGSGDDVVKASGAEATLS